MSKFLMFTWLVLLSAMGFAGEDEKKAADPHPALLDPAQAKETAPDTYRVKFETTKGDFSVDIFREWAPLAADRFYNMVKIGYFREIPFYRVVTGWVAQFGFSGDPAINEAWTSFHMKDEPVKHPNEAGTLVFANSGPNRRSNQFFINFENNTNLDGMGFSPFGKVVGDGMTVVNSLYAGYGERGPNQGLLKMRGNAYAKASFPNLDYIKSVTLVKAP